MAWHAGIALGTSNIWQVRDLLLEVVREKVLEKQTDLTTFCDSIKQVDVSHIKEGAQKHAAEQQEKAQFCSKVDALRSVLLSAKVPDTPTKSISGQLTITQSTPIVPSV